MASTLFSGDVLCSLNKHYRYHGGMFQLLVQKTMHVLQRENTDVQNEAATRFHGVLEPYWRKDNALLQDAIEIEIHPGNRTWNQAFTVLDDNVIQHEKLIETIEVLEPVVWQS